MIARLIAVVTLVTAMLCSSFAVAGDYWHQHEAQPIYQHRCYPYQPMTYQPREVYIGSRIEWDCRCSQPVYQPIYYQPYHYGHYQPPRIVDDRYGDPLYYVDEFGRYHRLQLISEQYYYFRRPHRPDFAPPSAGMIPRIDYRQ